MNKSAKYHGHFKSCEVSDFRDRLLRKVICVNIIAVLNAKKTRVKVLEYGNINAVHHLSD